MKILRQYCLLCILLISLLTQGCITVPEQEEQQVHILPLLIQMKYVDIYFTGKNQYYLRGAIPPPNDTIKFSFGSGIDTSKSRIIWSDSSFSADTSSHYGYEKEDIVNYYYESYFKDTKSFIKGTVSNDGNLITSFISSASSSISKSRRDQAFTYGYTENSTTTLDGKNIIYYKNNNDTIIYTVKGEQLKDLLIITDKLDITEGNNPGPDYSWDRHYTSTNWQDSSNMPTLTLRFRRK